MATWVPIEDLDLSVRAYQVLKREGVTTADEVSLLTETDLLGMRNMGQGGIESVKRALALVGLRLRD
jgi:DNA-directed RNA polymerase subunit alpha